jgi:hypothetical protein
MKAEQLLTTYAALATVYYWTLHPDEFALALSRLDGYSLYLAREFRRQDPTRFNELMTGIDRMIRHPSRTGDRTVR